MRKTRNYGANEEGTNVIMEVYADYMKYNPTDCKWYTTEIMQHNPKISILECFGKVIALMLKDLE